MANPDGTSMLNPATDIRVLGTYALGDSTLIVEYLIENNSAPAFRLGAYLSVDTNFGGDTFVDSVDITQPALLSVGYHQATLTMGGGVGQLALPGAGAPLNNSDLRLLLVADDNNLVAEADADPFNEDNTSAFVGAYHVPGQALLVHGTDAVDVATLTAASGYLTLNVTGFPFPVYYSIADVSSIRIWGHDGNDSLNAAAVPKTVIVFGGNGADRVRGGSAADQFYGGLGADTYVFDDDVAQGVDSLFEIGADKDTLDFSQTTGKSITLNLSLTALQVLNANHSIRLNSASLFENVIGGSLGDVVTGNSLANSLTGGGGNDFLTGGSGDDTYLFDTDLALGTDRLNEGGGGNDTLNFSATTTRSVRMNLAAAVLQVVNPGLSLILNSTTTFENVIGGSLGDVLTGNSLANSLTGGGGNDALTGGAGNDTYLFDTDVALGTDTLNEGGGGNDTLNFSATTTRSVRMNLGAALLQVVNAGLSLILKSTATFENVVGGSLGDVLTGNSLANSLTGGGGNDALAGGVGDDSYVFDTDVSLGSDTLNETGGGYDTLDFGQTTTQALVVNLGTTALQVVNPRLSLTLNSAAAFEKVIGGSLGDTITGNSLNNILVGGAGADKIYGGGGRDLIIGGIGADRLSGDTGDDLLIAGTTSYDANSAALRRILIEWADMTKSYDTRITNLRAGVGGIRLQVAGVGATLFNDAPSPDILTGGLDRDWFFVALADGLPDRAVDELFDAFP